MKSFNCTEIDFITGSEVKSVTLLVFSDGIMLAKRRSLSYTMTTSATKTLKFLAFILFSELCVVRMFGCFDNAIRLDSANENCPQRLAIRSKDIHEIENTLNDAINSSKPSSFDPQAKVVRQSIPNQAIDIDWSIYESQEDYEKAHTKVARSISLTLLEFFPHSLRGFVLPRPSNAKDINDGRKCSGRGCDSSP